MLWSDITFGIEFEAGARGGVYERVVRAAEKEGFAHLVYGYNPSDQVRSAQVSGAAWCFGVDGGGIETKTPVCRDHDWPEVAAMIRLMQENGCNGNDGSSGMHTHYGTAPASSQEMFKMIAGWWTFEDSLFALVDQYRRTSGWCHPIRTRHSADALIAAWTNPGRNNIRIGQAVAECTRMAFGPNGGWPTFENRIHHCSLNPVDIYGWVQSMRALIDHWTNDMPDPVGYIRRYNGISVTEGIRFLQERVAEKLPSYMQEIVLTNLTDRATRYA